ncbi:PcfJ domain-containing protein [Patescibacteria group bacterium]|nr:PcfJ domain-containing protein [Patescibacteria group bacterium]
MSAWGMVRLGRSIRELALEQYEDILGWDAVRNNATTPSSIIDTADAVSLGHKPPRADIAKLKEYFDIKHNSLRGGDQWRELTDQTETERTALQIYQYLIQLQEQGNKHIDPFKDTIDVLSGKTPDWSGHDYWKIINDALGGPSLAVGGDIHYTTDQAKDALSSGLKKQQIQQAPRTYGSIKAALDDLLRYWPESYKLWPWLVKQIKTQSGIPPTQHFVDVVGEAGTQLNKLRQENKLPQNFDINKMNFDEFEEWFQDWKRENRESESQGEVVYQYHDGWTMQRLTSPESLQYEGDEMGHCVGGYANRTDTGQSIIYSLRDPKGLPHVTIEVEGYTMSDYEEYKEQNGEQAIRGRLGTQRNYAPHEWTGSPKVKFDPSALSLADNVRDPKAWQKVTHPVFDVVQIQGNSNQTPKPEYQHKVKEFFDYLREQGVTLQRSDNWFGNFDEDEDEDYDIYDTADLDSVYNAFRNHPERWAGGAQDEYGMAYGRKYANGASLDDWIDGIIDTYVYGDELREKYRMGEVGDPQLMAEQIYYYAALGNWGNKQVRDALNQGWKHLDNGYEDVLEKHRMSPWNNEPSWDDDIDEDEYYKQQAEWEKDMMGAGWDEAREFLTYLDALFSTHGIPHPRDLPHNGGGAQGHIPGYGDIVQNAQPGATEPPTSFAPFPGALR